VAERSGNSASEIREISLTTTAAAERRAPPWRWLAPDIGKTADLVARSRGNRGAADRGRQIGQAMMQLDTVVQRNASAAEELAAAAQTLNDEADPCERPSARSGVGMRRARNAARGVGSPALLIRPARSGW
jgi:methyl-accepting chemotaxis protein